MLWNLRMKAAEAGIWKSTELRRRLAEAQLQVGDERVEQVPRVHPFRLCLVATKTDHHQDALASAGHKRREIALVARRVLRGQAQQPEEGRLVLPGVHRQVGADQGPRRPEERITFRRGLPLGQQAVDLVAVVLALAGREEIQVHHDRGEVVKVQA